MGNLNLFNIKEEVLLDVSPILKANGLTEIEINQTFDSFIKVVLAPTTFVELSGLSREILPALERIFVKKETRDIGLLKNFAANLEPYIKKILSINTTQSAFWNKNLMGLLKICNANNELSNQVPPNGYPYLHDTTLQSFIGKRECLYEICLAYLTRNDIHNSQSWNRTEITQRQISIMVVYLYISYKNQALLASLPEVSEKEKSTIAGMDKSLYHFFTFGNSAHRLKSQLIESLILNQIKQDGELTNEEIQRKLNLIFNGSLSPKNCSDLLIRLVSDNKITLNKSSHKYSLTAQEVLRINRMNQEYDDSKAIFMSYIQDILISHKVDDCSSQLYNLLEEVFEKYSDSNFTELFENLSTKETNVSSIFENILSEISRHAKNEESIKPVLKDLIQLTLDNQILIRISASRAFLKLSNTDKYEQYLREESRIVYLDTQVIIHMLCIDYVKNPKYDNIYFESATELIKLRDENPNIEFRVSKYYLREVAYQLRLALYMIPIENYIPQGAINNPFVKFYFHLKENHLLDNEDDNLEIFMQEFFRLNESDAYHQYFDSIAINNLRDFLADMDIVIEEIQVSDKSLAVQCIKEVLNETNRNRSGLSVPIENDAMMLAFLADKSKHLIEPFFLSWDRSFYKFRLKYSELMNRSSISNFYIFNPIRFINHLEVGKLRLNPQLITSELISFLGSSGVVRINSIWDFISKFLSYDGVNSGVRTRNAGKIKALLEKEYNQPDNSIKEQESIENVLENRLEQSSTYFIEQDKMPVLKKVMLEEVLFDEMINLIFNEEISSEDFTSQLHQFALKAEELMKLG